ncbi:hypothetical protein INT45_008514 [Circinella minor]|uniref:Uncharacterized protein n=1 Tax=Circinella minor TaxID=1195481 RepID=A0A8H7VNK7_9FUNG|nr:hypothetical protein INT45_008514 [Circinella minor]
MEQNRNENMGTCIWRQCPSSVAGFQMVTSRGKFFPIIIVFRSSSNMDIGNPLMGKMFTTDDNVVMNAKDNEFVGNDDRHNENETINIDQDIQNYSHPLVLVVIFLVFFQVHLCQNIYLPSSSKFATLRRITGFSALTDSLRKYVFCSNCHCLFLLSGPNCLITCLNNDIRYPTENFKLSITMDKVKESNNLLLQFCIGVQRLYGAEEITPNMHLHLHMVSTIEDSGPLYAYWAFAYERYNGYLKDIDTNQKDSFEMTFMKRFLQKIGARNFIRSFESLFHHHQHHLRFLNRFLDLVQPIPQTVNAIHNRFDPHEFYSLATDTTRCRVTESEPLPPDTYPLSYGRTAFMPEGLYNFLLGFYRVVYGDHLVHYTSAGEGCRFVSNQYNKIKTITLMDQNYRSVEARSRRGAYAQVLFHADDCDEAMAWPCEIQFFFRHVQVVNGDPTEHVFAYVRWYNIHGDNDGRRFVDPFLETWCSSFRVEAMDCIVPVHRL